MTTEQACSITGSMNQIAGYGTFQYDEKGDTILEHGVPIIFFVGFNYELYWGCPMEYLKNDMEIRYALSRYNPDFMLLLDYD